MIASGMLNRSPKNKPTVQPGHGSRTAPMVKPIAKRAMNAAVMAARLSEKFIGSMIATSTAPNSKPQMTPRVILDISHPCKGGEKDKHWLGDLQPRIMGDVHDSPPASYDQALFAGP